MKRIVHLISSPRGGESFSIKLANAVVAKLQDEYLGSSTGEIGPLVSSKHARFFTPNFVIIR